MNLCKNSSEKDQFGNFRDKAVYVAIIAKMKAHLHDYPGTFARCRELLGEHLQRASDNFWDEERLEQESIKPARRLKDLLGDMLEVKLLFRRDVPLELLSGSEKYNVLDFLDEVKASYASETDASQLYDSLISLMQEYVDGFIDNRTFMRRGLDHCGLASSSPFLKRLFTGQFCADIQC